VIDPVDEQVIPVRRGAARALIAVYAVFAVAATSRALYQLVTRFGEAPLAYALSAFAAVLYLGITFCLVRSTPQTLRIARAGIVLELVGVLIVGTASFVDSAAFPRATVWSHYGEGYGFVPLLLPILGLWYLRRSGSTGGAH
jgi:hypothetical protein